MLSILYLTNNSFQIEKEKHEGTLSIEPLRNSPIYHSYSLLDCYHASPV
jgi:hypothetical protein